LDTNSILKFWRFPASMQNFRYTNTQKNCQRIKKKVAIVKNEFMTYKFIN